MKQIYANLLFKLAILYVIINTVQTASVSLGSQSVLLNQKNFQYPPEESLRTNRLLLRDCPVYPFLDNAVDHIRALIVDKLNLPHLEWQILQATYTDKGLLFEMATEKDAKQVLESFAVKMKNKECVLKATIKEFFDVTVRR